MRYAAAILALSVLLSPVTANAYTKFIPLGTPYTPEQQSLPPLNSREAKTSTEADIIESDLYTRQMQAKQFDHKLNEFMDNGNMRPGSGFIDY